MSTHTISARLTHLESAGLITLAAIQPELEYVFRHTLVKDAAYASLVRRDRRGLHRLVAETLERLYLVEAGGTPAAARLPRGELLPLLGHHCAEAGELKRAAAYFTQAGDAAAHIYANAEAVVHYTRALELVRAWPEESERLNDLYTRRGRAQEMAGEHAAAADSYRELEALGRQRGRPALVLSALTARATIMAIPSTVYAPQRAHDLAEAALSLARELGDQAAEARALWTLMLADLALGQPGPAVQYGQRALALAQALDRREQEAYVLSDLSRAYVSLGDVAAARRSAEAARPLWEAEGNLPMLADLLSNLGSSYFFTGEYAAALTHLREAQAIARAVGNAWGQAYSLMLQSFLLMDQGLFDDCRRASAECLRLSAEGGLMAPQATVKTGLALLYSSLGQTEHGLTLAYEALALLEGFVADQRAEALTVLAWLYTDLGDTTQAEAYLRQAQVALTPDDLFSFAPLIAATAEANLALRLQDPQRAVSVCRRAARKLEQTGFNAFLAEVLLPWARALRALDQPDEAEAVLLRARALVEQQGSRRIRWRILAELGKLAELRGEPEPARALWAEARVAVEFLAEHAGDDALRASFLGLPDVQAVLAAAAGA